MQQEMNDTLRKVCLSSSLHAVIITTFVLLCDLVAGLMFRLSLDLDEVVLVLDLDFAFVKVDFVFFAFDTAD